MQIKTVLFILLLTCLTACSARKLTVEDFDTQVEDKFITAIKGDGIKLFTYTVKYAQLPTKPGEAPVLQMERKTGSANRKVVRRGDLSQWTQQVELGLNKTISMTGYCREGYIELSRIIEVGRAEIRGECNDGATQADLAKFDH
ncbi:hypothetical protein LZP69_10020 [Shewanella sp. AS1]|uniref:hypothetical protein n=1 Tax=Shewanella sp. AS1 TaxID=2907626 RepID=UPI001F1DEDFB|nr:hypothetical protein [Shewanella sp. AS1]MCE9679497.1 hypothetical protein [Shewanella sp. AS1]